MQLQKLVIAIAVNAKACHFIKISALALIKKLLPSTIYFIIYAKITRWGLTKTLRQIGHYFYLFRYFFNERELLFAKLRHFAAPAPPLVAAGSGRTSTVLLLIVRISGKFWMRKVHVAACFLHKDNWRRNTHCLFLLVSILI